MQLFGLTLSPHDLSAIAGTAAICGALLWDVVSSERVVRAMVDSQVRLSSARRAYRDGGAA